MKKVFLIIIPFVLMSCATIQGPLYSDVDMTIPEGKARIVVYRIWSGTGAIYTAGFFLNGEKVAELNNGGFNYVFVDPGKYVVSHGPDKNPYHKKVTVIATSSGSSYFVGLQRGLPDDIYLGYSVEFIDGYRLQTYQP